MYVEPEPESESDDEEPEPDEELNRQIEELERLKEAFKGYKVGLSGREG